MTEADIFSVQSPETGDLGFVSVLGMLGEHFAMSLYLGPEGIHGFLDLQAMGPFADPNDLIRSPGAIAANVSASGGGLLHAPHARPG